MTNMLLMIGTSELLLIGALVLLLFGGKKLPEMMKGLGQGVRSFKEGINEGVAPQGTEPPVSTSAESPEQKEKQAHESEDVTASNEGKDGQQPK